MQVIVPRFTSLFFLLLAAFSLMAVSAEAKKKKVPKPSVSIATASAEAHDSEEHYRFASVSCGGGKLATAAGLTSGVGAMGWGWAAQVAPTSTKSWVLSSYLWIDDEVTNGVQARAICLKQKKAKLTIRQRIVTVGEGDGVINVNCKKNERAVGGGFEPSDFRDDYLEGSYPANKTTWRVGYYHDSSDAVNLTAYASCLKTKSKVSIVKTKPRNFPAKNDVLRVQAKCGKKGLLVGGGSDITDRYNDYFMNGFPKSKKVWEAAGWSGYTDHTLTAYAVCIK